MASVTQITNCRVSHSNHLVPILDLGTQFLTGIFPRSDKQQITSGPLQLVWNPDCGLVQLNHTYDPLEMYGDNYGYRSGLNQSMVDHLTSKVANLQRMYDVRPGDTVLDIGSNDATTLKAYSVPNLNRIGIDPTAEKFQDYYTQDIKLVPEFFDADVFRSVTTESAKVITSIAMFYDLDDPIKFARDVSNILRPDGVWHLEQSYMPAMLRTTSYDTVCHEHIEYYSLSTIKYILDRADLEVADVIMNSINGGSFAVTAVNRSSPFHRNKAVIEWLLEQEDRWGLGTPAPYREFEERVYRHRMDLSRLIKTLRADGKRILGYGASTKGNVLLQFCKLSVNDIEAIAEVNVDKFGCVTPGTHIPIISEKEARAMKPDYFIVLPWHFKDSIVRREAEFSASGGHLIFPLPEIEIR